MLVHLIHGAENVSVVLLKAPHSRQPGQSSRQLVPVQDPEICQPQRQLPPRARPVTEHQAAGQKQSSLSNGWDDFFNYSPWVWVAPHLPVTRAVHWLQSEDILLHREREHVFTVVLPVARCLPQLAVVNVGGSYFLKASSPVLVLEQTAEPHDPNTPSEPHRYSTEHSHNMTAGKSPCDENSILFKYMNDPQIRLAVISWRLVESGGIMWFCE